MATTSPIQHVVVLMLENRSFDHMLGYHAGVNGLTGNEYNLVDPTKAVSSANPAYYVSNAAPFAIPAGEGPGHSFHDANSQVYNNISGPAPGFPLETWASSKTIARNWCWLTGSRTRRWLISKPSWNPSPPGGSPRSRHSQTPSACATTGFPRCRDRPSPIDFICRRPSSFGYVMNDWSQIFNARTIYNNLQDAGFTWAVYTRTSTK